ncbi:Abi family protein [Aliarcobacter skirrowii]|uniref:Abi family protein n=1 Tax=Aliarcobacter skirrowii TaxID=28200 RepID=UPI000F678F1C|nr:Abi family protein [Aliarcobacter skirrowii]AZL54402.1 Abi family protein [Aliarcobacter skirrowii]
MKLQFSKSYLSYQEQIELLKSRNLEILDSNYALKKLSNINYYRLSAYFYPFFDQKDTFRKDVTFEQIMQLYYFDKEFRTLVFFAIEKIEVYLRTQITRVVSEENGVFGYVDKNIFHNENLHISLLEAIKSETSRSKEVFVKDFYDRYEEEYLPVWAMVEIVSFNTLSKLFANLKEPIRAKIVKDMGIKPFVFQRWLHTFTYVRNICAHHSRLWNKMLAIEPMIPKNQKLFQNINNQKIFFVLTMILFILEKIDSEEFDFKKELKHLLDKYSIVDIKAMGFSDTWKELEIWK